LLLLLLELLVLVLVVARTGTGGKRPRLGVEIDRDRRQDTVDRGRQDREMEDSLEVAVLVGGHLGQSEDGVAALEAVVVRLLVGVRALVDAARLRRRELFEAGRQDRVGLLVLAPVGHHFVRVGAHKVALEAVEVRRLVLHRPYSTTHTTTTTRITNLFSQRLRRSFRTRNSVLRSIDQEVGLT